ncbi:MAG: hypothetical protein K9M81_05465, partial [Chthoniobacterales bacterium]|nr:hypothetical protein [Chthoniobacterales bacterium]
SESTQTRILTTYARVHTARGRLRDQRSIHLGFPVFAGDRYEISGLVPRLCRVTSLPLFIFLFF